MIEIVNIFFQLFLFCFLFFVPISFQFYKKLFGNYKYSLFDIASINIIIFFSICLMVSFLSIDLKFLFFSIIAIVSLLYLKNLSQFLSFVKKNNKNLFYLFVIFNFALFFELANLTPLGWDAITHWLPKAFFFFENGNYKNLGNYNYHSYTYPHLGSYIWAFFWKNSFLELEYYGRLYFIFVYLISIYSVAELINQILDFKKKIVIFFVIFIMFSLTYSVFVLNGYQEYLIFSLIAIVGKFLFILKKNIIKKNIYLTSFLLLASILLPWIKDEGIVYLSIITIVLIFFTDELSFSSGNKIVLFLVILFSVFSQYFIEAYFSSDYKWANTSILHSGIVEYLYPEVFFKRSLNILKFFFISFFKTPVWLVIVSAFGISFFIKNCFSSLKYHFVFFALNILALYSIYFTTPHDQTFFLTSGLFRLLIHTSGFYLIFVSLVIKRLYKKNNFI